MFCSSVVPHPKIKTIRNKGNFIKMYFVVPINITPTKIPKNRKIEMKPMLLVWDNKLSATKPNKDPNINPVATMMNLFRNLSRMIFNT